VNATTATDFCGFSENRKRRFAFRTMPPLDKVAHIIQSRDTTMEVIERYLELLKKALLNDIYVESDFRLLYLFHTLHIGENIDLEVFRNAANRLPDWFSVVKGARQEGRVWWKVGVINPDGSKVVLDLRNVCQFSHTMVGHLRLDNIANCLADINKNKVPGDVAETGAWRGGAAIFMKGCLTAWGMQDRTLWVADSFEGLPVPSRPEDEGWDFSAAKAPILAVSLEEVQENFRRYNLLDDNVKFLKGWFRDTLHIAPIRELALLRLDGDLFESTMDALNALYDKVSAGGYVIIDDFYDFEPCRRAVLEFREQHGIREPIEGVDWSGAFWRKSDKKK
jgi:O-methyltransferase